MKLSDLSSTTIEKIKAYRYDWIVEKHEGPLYWKDTLKYRKPEFIETSGYYVLLPRDQEHNVNITILRCIVSEDRQILTIFLKDTTYVDDLDYEFTDAGFLAICERVEGENFYLAVVYHEWFMTENPSMP
jgi:hypothetical protein